MILTDVEEVMVAAIRGFEVYGREVFLVGIKTMLHRSALPVYPVFGNWQQWPWPEGMEAHLLWCSSTI
jgi:hypothetical protein